MRLYPMLLTLVVVLAACTAPPAQAPECAPGELVREFGGCCPDRDLDGVCDQVVEPEPQPEPVQNETEPVPIQNTTDNTTIAAPPEPELSISERFGELSDRKVKTYSYYVKTPFGTLWVWQDNETIRYIAVEDLMEVERNQIVKSGHGYSKDEQQFMYRIEDRSEPVVSYIEYRRASTTYTACYIEGSAYGLHECIEDYPNGNPIVYGGIKFAAPKDPLAWLHQYDGKEPVATRERKHQDANGVLRAATEVTYLEQNGARTTFLVDSSYGAPYQVTVVDRYNVTKETLTLDGVAFNSQSNINGDPRLEAGYEYR